MIDKKNIFPIGIGTWGIGGFANRSEDIDKEKQIDALAYMFSKGMNFIEINLWYAQGYSAHIVAEAIKRSGKKRNELFICQAIYLKDKELKDTEEEVNQLLKLLGTDFIDTLQFTGNAFVKYGFNQVADKVEGLIKRRKTRFTSITNENLELLQKYHGRFGPQLFSHEVCYNFEIRVNEKAGLTDYAKNNGITTVIYQPLRRNRTAKRNWPILIELAKKYHATQNQIILSWILSKGFLPLTKSENICHIDEHLSAVDLKLNPQDLEKINHFTLDYILPKIDWNISGNGVTIDQLSNVFDEDYDNQIFGK